MFTEQERERMIPRVEQADYVTKPLVFRFLATEECDKCHGTGTLPSKKQYRVKASTQYTGGWIKSEPMTKQEAVQLLHELKAEINTPNVYAVMIGENLVMTDELQYLYLEEEEEEEE